MHLDAIRGTSSGGMLDRSRFTAAALEAEAADLFEVARSAPDLDTARARMAEWVHRERYAALDEPEAIERAAAIRVRDCAYTLLGMLTRRSEKLAGFSVAQVIHDLARGVSRPDLTPAFYADLFHILRGLRGRIRGTALGSDLVPTEEKHGREAGRERSDQLDALWAEAEQSLARYPSGLEPEVVALREQRRARVLEVLRGTDADWQEWRWHVHHVIRDEETLGRMTRLTEEERAGIRAARENAVPFGVTPYYAALMDAEPSDRDQAVRRQVIPPLRYVREVCEYREQDPGALDFMREADTSPEDLVTRRYPAICILKPVSTCPQICVYCQRNWEIQEAMASKAIARAEQVEAGLDWIAAHPAIHEVLITGGDPLILTNSRLERIMGRLAAMPAIRRIRIGTRTPITLPMRITEKAAALLGRYHDPGHREVAVVTHCEHAYEITPDVVRAINRIRKHRIPVFNQQVFTFFVSRRFETAALRMALSTAGIRPYYCFNMKGKREMRDYRVPIARLLQEQREEARLLPGVTRTDHPVYNVPGKGKNHLRARQHRHFLAIRPTGERVYEFHPWEKHLTRWIETHVGEDVPILEYLERLAAHGEDVSEYATIWYYF